MMAVSIASQAEPCYTWHRPRFEVTGAKHVNLQHSIVSPHYIYIYIYIYTHIFNIYIYIYIYIYTHTLSVNTRFQLLRCPPLGRHGFQSRLPSDRRFPGSEQTAAPKTMEKNVEMIASASVYFGPRMLVL